MANHVTGKFPAPLAHHHAVTDGDFIGAKYPRHAVSLLVLFSPFLVPEGVFIGAW